MADFAKLSIKGLYSKSSDYSDPVTTFTPSAYEMATADVDEYFHTELEPLYKIDMYLLANG